MALTAQRVSVTTSATVLGRADQDGASILARNDDASVDVFLGASDVLLTTGYRLTAGQAVAVDLDPGEILYGIVASGTVVVHTIKTRA